MYEAAFVWFIVQTILVQCLSMNLTWSPLQTRSLLSFSVLKMIEFSGLGDTDEDEFKVHSILRFNSFSRWFAIVYIL